MIISNLSKTDSESQGGGGGYSEIFYTYVGSSYFLGLKVLNINIFFFGGGVQKIFFFVLRFCGYFLGSPQN